MSRDEMIHIPARKKQPATGGQIVRVSEEAYNAIVEIYNESTLSMSQIASILILASADRVVYDKEDM